MIGHKFICTGITLLLQIQEMQHKSLIIKGCIKFA